MNKAVIAILGIVCLIAAGEKFNGNSDLVFMLMIAFVFMVLASDKKKE
ncbi:MAG: hypothetical protein J6Y71_04465 [Ruminococcus sp.]|nr:hypothetical protein [Ruminococcus sp.]